MYQKAKEEIKKCKYCGKEFQGIVTRAYCCNEHRVQYWNEYRKQYFNNKYYPVHKGEIIKNVKENKNKRKKRNGK